MNQDILVVVIQDNQTSLDVVQYGGSSYIYTTPRGERGERFNPVRINKNKLQGDVAPGTGPRLITLPSWYITQRGLKVDDAAIKAFTSSRTNGSDIPKSGETPADGPTESAGIVTTASASSECPVDGSGEGERHAD